MDDNFSSIVGAVEEGRVMFDNIKKLLAYTMPHSFPEVWPIIVNFCFGWPVGITALQVIIFIISFNFKIFFYFKYLTYINKKIKKTKIITFRFWQLILAQKYYLVCHYQKKK